MILFVMYAVVFVTSTFDGNISAVLYVQCVNVMQCHVPLLRSLFLAGNVVTFDLRCGIFLPLLIYLALRVSPRDAAKTGPLQTLHLKFLPTDSNHFFIGTNMVSVISFDIV